MSDVKKYTVIDLAGAVGVPRTTVTDWLGRYSQYIEFKMQGKRKIYTENSVAVLKEISELRNKGLSSFDIEEELAKRHPVHVEVDSSSSNGENFESEGASDSDDSSQIVLRKSVSEMGEMIKSTLIEMNRRIEEIERINERNVSRANRWFAASLFAVFILFATATGAYFKIGKSLDENEKLRIDNSKYVSDLKASLERLEKSRLEVFGLDRQVVELESGFKKKGEEFQKTLSEMKKDLESSKAVEILELRDKFAGERLSLLKNLEDTGKSREEMNQLVAKLQNQIAEQSAAIKNLSEKLSGPAAREAEKAEDSPPDGLQTAKPEAEKAEDRKLQ